MAIFNEHSRIYQWLTDSDDTQLLLKFSFGSAVLIEKQLPFGVIAKAGKISKDVKDYREAKVTDCYFEEREWIYSEEGLVNFIWHNALDQKARLSVITSFIESTFQTMKGWE